MPSWLAALTGPWPAPAPVGPAAAALLVALTVLGSLRAARRGRLSWRALAATGALPWPAALLTVAATAALAAALTLWPPLRWGWWPALGGWGTAVTGVTAALPRPARVLAAALACAAWAWAGPSIAAAEERTWRAGTPVRGGLARLWRVGAFALLHAASGMPLGWALALVVPAAAFTRAAAAGDDPATGLAAATRLHACVNAALVPLALAVAAFGSG